MKCKFCGRKLMRKRSNQRTCGRLACKRANLKAAYQAWLRRKLDHKHQMPSAKDGYTPVKVVTVWHTGRSETSMEFARRHVSAVDRITTGFARREVDQIREEVER